MCAHVGDMSKEFVLPPRRRFSSREKRRNAEVECVRGNSNWRGQIGLTLAHQLKDFNPEMRWLAELFPLEPNISDEVADERLSAWCGGHPDDATALRYLAGARRDPLLMGKAAAMGDARAMVEMVSSSSFSDDEKFQLACASAAKGDANGTHSLMQCFELGIGCKKNDSFAGELLERAASLSKVNEHCS